MNRVEPKPSAPMPITRETVVCATGRVIARQVENETVMMDVQRGCYYGLDPVASHVWSLLDKPVSVGQLCERLAVEYAVSPERCEREVIDLLTDMASRDIVRISADGP